MRNNKLRHWVSCGVLIIGMGITLGASASGTLSPGGGADSSEYGRRTYLKKLACSDCPLPGGVTDKAAAMTLVDRIKNQEFSLSERERKAVLRYLNRRWDLD